MKVLAIAGSLREQSYNRGLVRAAQALAPSGMTITIGEIADVPMYNGDD
ncbi:NADPH-dependent FMN reductase, partial [Alcanivorax sp. HI0044]